MADDPPNRDPLRDSRHHDSGYSGHDSLCRPGCTSDAGWCPAIGTRSASGQRVPISPCLESVHAPGLSDLCARYSEPRHGSHAATRIRRHTLAGHYRGDSQSGRQLTEVKNATANSAAAVVDLRSQPLRSGSLFCSACNQLNSPRIYACVCCCCGFLKICSVSPNSTR